MAQFNARELLFRYTGEAIRGLCMSGKVELADKLGEKAAVIAEKALARNQQTLKEWQRKQEREDS